MNHDEEGEEDENRLASWEKVEDGSLIWLAAEAVNRGWWREDANRPIWEGVADGNRVWPTAGPVDRGQAAVGDGYQDGREACLSWGGGTAVGSSGRITARSARVVEQGSCLWLSKAQRRPLRKCGFPVPSS